MSQKDYQIDEYIQSVREKISKISGFEDEFNTPLNQYLQEKYERSRFSPHHTGKSAFEDFENSYSAIDFKEDPGKLDISASNYFKHIDPNDYKLKIHSLESRIGELMKIQEALIKSIEENKISTIRTEQNEKRAMLELREKLAIAQAKISNFEKDEGKEQMKRAINELEQTKSALKQENSSLLARIHGFGKDLQFIEKQSKSMNEELRLLKEKNADLQGEIMFFKSEKVEFLKRIDELSRQINSSHSEISEKNSQISVLEERISDLKSLIQSTSLVKLQDFSMRSENPDTKVCKLAKENQELRDKISQRPTFNQIQTAKKKIASLEKAVDSMNMCGTIKTSNRSKSFEKKCSLASSTKILRKLMQEAHVDNPYTLIEVMRRTGKENKKAAKVLKFVDKAKELVLKSSPPQSYPNGLTVKKLWKWLKRLTAEYFSMKSLSENNEEAIKLINKLKTVFNLPNDSEAYQSFSKVLMENELLKLLLNKAKVVLRLNNKLSHSELESELDKRL